VLEAEPYSKFRFRWPWLDDESWTTEVTVSIAPRGYGSMITLDDGPFDLSVPGVIDAYAQCARWWGQGLAWLRALIDFSVDLRRFRA
jgi:hypothetical protein